jgi:NAD(P)-dependent dehydrogenase (short-subunit alcohol dehydrogenase family)
MPDTRRVWFITGVSSGFGRELAQAVLARGETVVGTLRRAQQAAEFRALAPGRSFAYELDLTEPDTIAGVLASATAEAGPIDVLVNNAGYGLFGAVEEVSDAEARRLMETNFFGLLALTRGVLPSMRERRRGHIVNFSSVAGFLGIPGCGLYCASKFAVEGLSEALAAEVKPFGIKVTLVEPGGFQTNFAGGSKVFAAASVAAYAVTAAAKTRELISTYKGREPGDPAKAARAIVQVVDAAEPPLRLVLGSDALARARGKLGALIKDYDTWEKLTCSTDVTR